MAENNGEEDRLSSLPEPILVEILSLLPLHSAATTSALSHRWRRLWTQTTDLILDTADFPNHTSDFFNIVDHILRQLTSVEIRRFKLRVRDPEAETIGYRSSYWKTFCSCLQPWISQICVRRVKKIQVIADNYLGDQMLVPDCVFQCRYLVGLKLGQGFDFELPGEINLPNLKKLSVNLGDCHRDLMRKLFRSCPLLENLSLLGTFEEDGHLIDISSHNLKRLSIQAWVLNNSNTISVAIDAPNLKFLFLYDCVGIKFWFVKEPSKSLELDVYGIQRPDGMSNTLELFQVISSVRSLRIDFALIHALNCLDDPKLPMLCNLTSLTLSVYPNYLKALMFLLHCSPNLEFLTMSMVPGLSEEEIGHSQITSDSVPVCVLTHVKRMEIVITEMEEIAIEFVKYLLNHATVLERVVVRIVGESEDKELQLGKELKLYEDFCKIPRSSLHCCVEFRGIEFQKEHHMEVR